MIVSHFLSEPSLLFTEMAGVEERRFRALVRIYIHSKDRSAGRGWWRRAVVGLWST